MGGLTRSLKYASFRAGRVIGICLLMAFGFVFYFALLDGTQFTLQNLLPRFPFMLLFIGNLMFMIYGMLDRDLHTAHPDLWLHSEKCSDQHRLHAPGADTCT